MREVWLSAETFSELANVSDRHARRILASSIARVPWQGSLLNVRQTTGRGGRSGTRYEVALSSLSEELQNRFNGAVDARFLVPDPVMRIIPAKGQAPERQRRLMILAEALDYPPRSPERAEALKRAERHHRIPLRTLQRWVKRHDDCGGDIHSLGRARPADAGKPRIVVSRVFDAAFRAAGYDEALLAEIGEEATRLIQAAWASPAQRHGWRRVGLEAETALARECRNRGLELPKGAFRISRYRIGTHDYFRVVDIYEHDRKRFDDAKPRIVRDNSKLRPLEEVVGDVKPLDNIVRRADGTGDFTVKLIAWQDTGTHRIFPYFVQVAPGEGIRQEHVIESFLAMVRHPEWGFPERLYLDNGSEYGGMDKIGEAIAMVAEPGARTIVRTKPYSGASKPIESTFSMLDRAVFSQMGGWAGGNRMNKKTQTLGKPPAPYQGSFAEFVAEAQLRITDFEAWPLLSGSFKGRSPTQVYSDWLDRGWRPSRVSPDAIDAAFCERITREVRRGSISIDGDVFTHPELPAFNGRTVSISMPWRRGAEPLFLLPGFGWTYLDRRTPHLPGDIAGAVEASRVQRNDTRAVRKLKRAAGQIDLAANVRERVAVLPTRAAPAPLMDVMASSDAHAIADGRAHSEVRRLNAPTEAERRRARRMAETEELERHYGIKRR